MVVLPDGRRSLADLSVVSAEPANPAPTDSGSTLFDCRGRWAHVYKKLNMVLDCASRTAPRVPSMQKLTSLPPTARARDTTTGGVPEGVSRAGVGGSIERSHQRVFLGCAVGVVDLAAQSLEVM
jgi:hypothetical protein